MDKKGDYKYGIILSLILGLMVLSLSLYFIFNELWDKEDIDMQICKQSIQLRSLLPEGKKAGFNLHSFKEEYPLKCKTMVKEVDADDVESGEASKIIAETMAECWALYDKGDANAFPSGPYGQDTTCAPCARIHLTNEAKKYMAAQGMESINIRNSLDEQMNEQDYSYYSYLENSGSLFPAFGMGVENKFDLEGEKFNIELPLFDKIAPILRDNVKVKTGEKTTIGGAFGKVSLPKLFYPERGDLIIIKGVITSASSSPFDYIPYLFYYQQGQGDISEQMNETVFQWGWTGFDPAAAEKMCNSWEGIPA